MSGRSTLPLEVALIFVTGLACAVEVAADVFHARLHPNFPLVPSVVSAVTLLVLANYIIAKIGQRTHRGYRIYQPFEGGVAFVSMQFIAFLTLAVSAFGSVLYAHVFLKSPLHHRSGALSMFGALATVGTVMHRLSIFLFSAAEQSLMRVVAVPPNRESLLVLVLLCGNLVMAITAHQIPTLRSPLLVTLLAVHFTCAGLVHFVIGWTHTPGYRLFMPLTAGVKAAFAQLLCWGLFTATAYTAVLLLQLPLDVTCVGSAASSTMVGLGSFVSCGSLLIFARTFTFTSPVRSSSALGRHGAFVLSFVASSLAALIISTTFVDFGRFTDGVAVWQGLSALALGLLPPLTHLLGAFAFAADGYNVWMPFRGSIGFVALQAVGWVFFGLGMLSGVLQLSSDAADNNWLQMCAASLAMSQYLVHASLKAFRAVTAPVDGPRVGLLPLDAINGELVTAGLLSASCLALCSTCDFLLTEETAARQMLLIAALVAAVLATPLAHVSARQHAPRGIQPFQGSAEFVALQAAGWTLYAIATLVGAVICVDRDFISPHGTLRWTVTGIIAQIPFVMITGSVIAVTRHRNRAAPLSEADIRTISKIAALVKTLPADAAERCELDAAMARLQADTATSTPVRNAVSAARMTVFVTCLASAVLFLLAALLSAGPQRADRNIARILCSAGVVMTTMSLVGIHTAFGRFVHGPAYKFWAPFEGGQRYLVTSGFAWGAYGAMIMLSIAFVVDLSSAVGILAIAAGLSVIAQVLLFVSVTYHFSLSAEPLFVNTNAEGILSAVIFTCAITFSHLYAQFTRRESTSPIPIIINAIGMVIAVPVGLGALQKSEAESRRALRDAAADDEQESDEAPLLAAEHLFVGMTVLLPLLLLYAAHFAAHQYDPGLLATLQIGRWSWGVLQAVVVAVLLSRTLERHVPEPIQRVRRALLCFALYSVPTIIVIFTYSLPAVHPSFASYTFVVAIVSFTLAATALLRRLVQAALLVALGATSYFHILAIVSLLESGDETPSILSAALVEGVTAELLKFLEDFICVGGWLWYSRSYSRHPEVTGKEYSPRFAAFMRRWVFEDVARYFSFRVVAEPGARGMCAAGSKSGRRCIMGFHPHGIFPGTAMWAPHTPQWQEALGAHSHVTTHAASILFGGPILRNFVLSLGGRVVTRHAIVQSLREGNSVIIVPGGQAEMIHSRNSDREMHLVAHHVGFIRIAVVEQAPLVPLLCLNESNVLDNVHLPRIQRAFLKRLGFGFPVVPFGRWFLPLPTARPLTLLVGNPIMPPSVKDVNDTAEVERHVAALKEVYFDSMRKLLEKHRVECGYPNMRLVLHDR